MSILLITSLLVCMTATESPSPTSQPPNILVLDNCDPDFKYPPFNDVVLLLNNKGEVVNRINGLNICQSVGDNRIISVSEDSHFFVVCEEVANKITAYNLSTGAEMWSLAGKDATTRYGGGRIPIRNTGQINPGEGA